jgi:outer membrane protein assembly factor BamB
MLILPAPLPLRKRIALLGSALLATLLVLAPAAAADWPQFRGPNCSGRAGGDASLPERIGPNTNVVWKTALPPGHSSPIVVGDRVYLTAERQKRLVTIALDRTDGHILWEVAAPARALEKIHTIGSHAQSTPTADRERVISFFGSCGLFCYDRAGKLLWQRPMGPFKNGFGAGSSPVLAGNRVLLCQDHDQDSFLMALDKHTGKILWKTDRSEFLRGYCTPVIWDVDGRKQVVVAGTLRVAGYDLETGKERWTVRGISRTVCMTPVVGTEGNLYLGGWAAGGDPGARIDVEGFDTVIKRLDKNGNGTLETAELTTGPMAERFNQVDVNKDGSITRVEYERFRGLFDQGRNNLLAIRPGGKGDVTRTHVVWRNVKQVPFCASPLYYKGLLYVVKDNGFVSCLDARDGKLVRRDRVPGNSNYYSSPVAGDGKVYLIDDRGRLTVIRAGRDWRVLSTSKFGEDAYATPALVEGHIYLRTRGHLYCFGNAARSTSK